MAKREALQAGTPTTEIAMWQATNPAMLARVAMGETARAMRDALLPWVRANRQTRGKTTSQYADSERANRHGNHVSYRRSNRD